jgi:hypothetical protein
VFDLDPAAIGGVLQRLGSLAWQMGHESVSGTISPYCRHPELLSPEAQFVSDLFSLTTRQLVDRWYGGPDGASRLSAAIAGRMLESPE